MEQNNSVNPVLIKPTYKDHPRFFQNGILPIRICMFSRKWSPKNSGGGTLKISVRGCVANTNMK